VPAVQAPKLLEPMPVAIATCRGRLPVSG